jgi:hypothetical protein
MARLYALASVNAIKVYCLRKFALKSRERGQPMVARAMEGLASLRPTSEQHANTN